LAESLSVFSLKNQGSGLTAGRLAGDSGGPFFDWFGSGQELARRLHFQSEDSTRPACFGFYLIKRIAGGVAARSMLNFIRRQRFITHLQLF